MPIPWPGASERGGDLPESEVSEIRVFLDQIADELAPRLNDARIPLIAAPMFRPFDIIGVKDPENLHVVLTELRGGLASERWSRHPQTLTADTFASAVQRQWPGAITLQITVPLATLATPAGRAREARQLAESAATAVIQQAAIAQLGDTSAWPHLHSELREFVQDHPNYQRNVFLMMRFGRDQAALAIHKRLIGTLKDLGYDGLRADDRYYLENMWENILVYALGCKFGIAVFESLHDPAAGFNANVAVELGFMLGRSKRCLILREQQLPRMPADVVHRLAHKFDGSQIDDEIDELVRRWVTVDLRQQP